MVAVVATFPAQLEYNRPAICVGSSLIRSLQQESPQTIDKVKAVLEKHPWYTNQWQSRFQDVPVTDRDMVLFMQAARWPDDIRASDKQQHRALWHYINWPKHGQPSSVQIREPEVLFSRLCLCLRVSPGQSHVRKGTRFYLGRGLPALLRCHPIASVGSVLVQLEQYRCS